MKNNDHLVSKIYQKRTSQNFGLEITLLKKETYIVF